jgi:hypothetical protein
MIFELTEQNEEFVIVRMTVAGREFHFTATPTALDWGHVGDDNWQTTESVAAAIGLPAEEFWQNVEPLLNKTAGY